MPEYLTHLTLISENSKTGPIPVSTSQATTCPVTCPQRETCYAKFGPLKYHWEKVNVGIRGDDWKTFCDKIRRLPHKQLWRHAQAGDLPGNGTHIDAHALDQLVAANRGKRGFTYTHYPVLTNAHNLERIEMANQYGFTINISCDSLTESDKVSELTKAPQVVVLPSTTTERYLKTPEGRKIVICPASYRNEVTCSNCGICYSTSPRRAVIGFPAHGTKKRVIDIQLSRGD